MSKNEKITDFFIGNLLSNAKIDFTPNGSSIKEIQDALKTASKKGTGKVGFPEFTAKSKDFIIVIEDKANLENQARYEDDDQTTLSTDQKSITNFAENGAKHYANEIISKTSFKKVFAFGCTGGEKHHIIRPIYVDEKGYKLLQKISKEKPSRRMTVKRIPSFGIRPQMEVGCMVTLRGNKAKALLKRLLDSIDNKIKKKQIAKNQFSFGIKEYIEIPGEEYDREIGMLGFNVVVVFSRKGKRVGIKKIKRGKLPERHHVTQDEIVQFMKENFKVRVE